eukprot:CAMPEP_0202881268 /NCGR_PEP_ID=MMETSP1391-20130828/36291_1 /ASSEMBLY_ACC=CAM_ASM_000867 /TAXON_ID=1034604 /ORGANISM="Chlamydomonas leiostraca, Strain SAG 11-49" /LENGTH=437 /DNA_ID=CAMNT_0049563925 /DNA_START=313 /DNA_END=1623 /DNA_ORIENTATION=+
MGLSIVDTDSHADATVCQCRICFDADPVAQLVAPCACRGSQQFVHRECLHQWQQAVLKLKVKTDRAYRCSVCLQPFSIAPRGPPLRQRAAQSLLLAARALCTFLALGCISASAWPHLALPLVLMLATACLLNRPQSLLCGVLLALGAMLTVLHCCGLRLVVRVEPEAGSAGEGGGYSAGGRMGLALIRHGAPVGALRAGMLLVASRSLSHTMFREAVVLVTHHSSQGTRGVMLTRPVPASPRTSLDAAHPARAAPNTTAPTSATAAPPSCHVQAPPGLLVRQFVGGPVGTQAHAGGSLSALTAETLLHTLPGLDGAQQLLPADHLPASQSPVLASCSAQSRSGCLYIGGRLPDAVHAAALQQQPQPGAGAQSLLQASFCAASTAVSVRQQIPDQSGQQQQVDEREGEGEQQPHHRHLALLFHGYAGWGYQREVVGSS